jgi:phosphohistidine phosphatase SixA
LTASLFTNSRLLSLAGMVLALLAVSASEAPAQGDAWALLKQPGLVVLMRHSEASEHGGYGDPPGFRLDDCATQRNLSEEGRAHARRTGEAFRQHGVSFDRVLTSPWCRCKETAQLAMGKDAELYTPLSNLVGRPQHRDEQVKAIRTYLAGLDPNTRMLFVTHGIVISAMTGISPASGEMVIVKVGRGGETAVAGRLKVD